MNVIIVLLLEVMESSPFGVMETGFMVEVMGFYIFILSVQLEK